jgi:chorismate mutase
VPKARLLDAPQSTKFDHGLFGSGDPRSAAARLVNSRTHIVQPREGPTLKPHPPRAPGEEPPARTVADDSQRSELEALRSELDGIDVHFRETLKNRIECCIRIAEYKKDHDVPMMQPHRIGIVQDRAAAFAKATGIDPGFMRGLYSMIINETCRIEDEVIGGNSGWLG